MRKYLHIVLIVFMIFMVSACMKPADTYTVITPIGSPQLAQIHVQNMARYQTDAMSGPELLQAAFTSGSHDFIFAPTNLGAKFYSVNQKYKLAASIVWGNTYIVSQLTKIVTLEDLEGRDIVVYGKNQTGDIILNYILNHHNIKANISYVSNVSDANIELVKNKNAIIMTAEPSLSVLSLKLDGLHVIDLQKEYQTITGKDSYPQASLFVKADLPEEVIKKYITFLKSSIEQANQEPLKTAKLAIKLGMNFDEKAIEKAIPNSNLLFKSAVDSKEAVEAYLSLLAEININLIGSMPDENFYFRQ